MIGPGTAIAVVAAALGFAGGDVHGVEQALGLLAGETDDFGAGAEGEPFLLEFGEGCWGGGFHEFGEHEFGEVPAGKGIGFGTVGAVNVPAEVGDELVQAAGGQVGEHEAGEFDGAELGFGGALPGDVEVGEFGAEEAVVEAEVVGGEDAVVKAAVVAGPDLFGQGTSVDHGLGDASELGDLAGDGDAGVDEVGALFVDAVGEAGVEDGDFDDTGVWGLEAGGFDVDDGEGLLGDAAVVAEEVGGVEGEDGHRWKGLAEADRGGQKAVVEALGSMKTPSVYTLWRWISNLIFAIKLRLRWMLLGQTMASLTGRACRS